MKTEELKEELTNDAEALEGEINNLSDKAKDYARQLCKKTGETIKDNPWKAITIAAGVGVLVGWLIRK